MFKKITLIILTGISNLTDYNVDNVKATVCRTCQNCSMVKALQLHGHYFRKANRSAEPGNSLNLVKVLRLICKFCRKTCRALPECIPPLRWYLWQVQQAVIQDCILGESLYSISQKFKVARSTVRRWFQHLQNKFPIHADVLRNMPGNIREHLVHYFDVKSFWQSCFSKISLARAMLLCHRANINIP